MNIFHWQAETRRGYMTGEYRTNLEDLSEVIHEIECKSGDAYFELISIVKVGEVRLN